MDLVPVFQLDANPTVGNRVMCAASNVLSIQSQVHLWYNANGFGKRETVVAIETLVTTADQPKEEFP